MDLDGNFEFSPVILIQPDHAVQRAPQIYPNPARTTLHINLAGQKEEKTALVLYDATGSPIWQQHDLPGNSSMTINLESQELSAGIYFLQKMNGSVLETFKIVIDD